MQISDNRSRFKDLLRIKWNPQPVEPPKVDPQLHNLDPLTRSAETIRYSVLSVEFWCSSNGQLREWLRHNSRLALLLAIPAFLVLPVITFALWQLVSWVMALTAIAGKLILFPIMALVALIACVVAINIIKSLFRD